MKANISLLGSLAVAGLALVGCQKPAEKTAAGSTAASTTASSSTETSSSMAEPFASPPKAPINPLVSPKRMAV